MKKVAACMIIVICIIVSLGGMINAVEKPSVKARLIKSSTTVTTADIEIMNAIIAYCGCKTVCDQMDAIAIVHKPALALRNNGPATTEVTVTATVFNYKSNSEITYTEKIQIPAKQNVSCYIESMAASSSYPVVVKKSYGVKLKVLPSTPGITDPKPSNNSLTIKSCESYVSQN